MGDNYFYSLDGPLDSTPGGRQMRVANLSGLPQLVRLRGGDPRSLLERHEIDPHLIRDPELFIDCQSVVELFEDCSTSLRDPYFGLELAEMQDPDVFGCVTALCRSAPTVRSSVNCFIDYIPVTHSPDALLELVENDEIAEIRWEVGTDLGCNDQANYQAALLNLKLLRDLGGPRFRPSYVNLAVDPRGAHLNELELRLGCQFNQTRDHNAIAFPSSLLDQPVRSANRLLFRLLGGYLEQVRTASRSSIAEQVDDYVRGALSSGQCSIEHCARKLDIPVRTLQAQLADSGLKFTDILERQRLVTARAHLGQPEFSLDEVADLLGYAEQSSFGRAFKRWTGQTPRQYQQSLRGDCDLA